MSILLPFDVAERRVVAKENLAPLVKALRSELEPLLNGALPIPEQKARLTRTSGRCAFDGTYLAFDPYSPHEHKCNQCHRVYMDRAHDDWWAMGAQLWIAERAVQAAALNLVTDDPACGALAVRILHELSDRYQTWPNKDNALGPTRPFFSTYLESIWLLNLCHAIALLEQCAVSESDARILSVVRENLVRPSRDLIAGFHEGRSNRQVWNEVAILSASQVLGDDATIARRLDENGGLLDLFALGLLDDGTWYEGENYHLFAHRGLWYGAQLLRALNRPLPVELEARYRAGFVTPFLGILPDDTIPSRRDSQYRVSIRQWRFAEWCELGIAHAVSQAGATVDARLVGTLHRLYHPDSSLRLASQHRHAFSTADAERNEPVGLLSRADLSWRALLMATPVLHEGSAWSPGSVCLPRQGLAVIRRERGDMYIALEGGHTGGGHGHPDRLALTVQHKHSRWLEDPGTGSYVDPSLHWYRSTLAHAAPLVDGASQDPVPAKLLAFDDRGWAGWMVKRVENVKPGVHLQRTVVTFGEYLIDVLEWDADRSVRVELPIARTIDAIDVHSWRPAEATGAGGLEDGFNFLADVQQSVSVLDVDEIPSATLHDAVLINFAGDRPASALYNANVEFSTWRATAPGSPGANAAPIHWIRAEGSRGWIAGVWSWSAVDPAIGIQLHDEFPGFTARSGDTTSVHKRTPDGWNIALTAGKSTSSIDLVYLPREIVAEPDGESTLDAHNSKSRREREAITIPRAPATFRTELGERNYLRTEQTWSDANQPTAVITMAVTGDTLQVTIAAFTGEVIVPPAGAQNQLDNERVDVNSDGVELFIGANNQTPWTASWLVVPASDELSSTNDTGATTSARITGTTPHSPAIKATWNALFSDASAVGFEMCIEISLHDIPVNPDGEFILELIVNERPADRVRRRGMLVLSGGGGFGYLRGDRAEPAIALPFRLHGSERALPPVG